jgi:hypothetical protein
MNLKKLLYCPKKESQHKICKIPPQKKIEYDINNTYLVFGIWKKPYVEKVLIIEINKMIKA